MHSTSRKYQYYKQQRTLYKNSLSFQIHFNVYIDFYVLSVGLQDRPTSHPTN
jgi:hypothetical protein